jgi:NADPH-dependent 2,4-dienoyl-CoA reductase/sulfur reductase-like enzyme
MKVILVGGVPGGASCAARLPRLDEHAEIIMVVPVLTSSSCGAQKSQFMSQL